MAFVDYYKILGVDKTIPQKDVKKAYLKRAKQFHPEFACCKRFKDIGHQFDFFFKFGKLL